MGLILLFEKFDDGLCLSTRKLKNQKENVMTQTGNQTEIMLQMFAKAHSIADARKERQAEIHDVLRACFPSETRIFTKEIMNYPRAIEESEKSFQMIRLRYEDDIQEMNDHLARADKKRSYAHNAAINAAAQLDALCDQLGIDHLFSSKISKEAGKRILIGEEMLSFVDRIKTEASGSLKAKNTANQEAWITLFNSRKPDAVERACKDNDLTIVYTYCDKPVDKDLTEEIHAFNQYSVEKTGKPVYDETVSPLQSGIEEIDRYLINKGRTRWYQ